MATTGAVALALMLPMAAFGVLRSIPALNGLFRSPIPHFWIVRGTSLLALLVALAVLTVALRRRDPCVAYLGIGLMLIAGGSNGVNRPPRAKTSWRRSPPKPAQSSRS